jgi:tRNA (guanine-N(7)-)-methyltransferase subunit TRM82
VKGKCHSMSFNLSKSDRIVRIPALLIYLLSQNATLSHLQTLLLNGNPLDLLVDCSYTKLVVSLDTIHEPGTTSKLRTNLDSTVRRLLVFGMKDGSKWTKECLQFTEPAPEEESPGEGLPGKYGGLSSLFYSLRNLRKCGGEK